jgi:hypothetical protein
MAGRTRTFVDSTGSQAIRGLQESLMAGRTYGNGFGQNADHGAVVFNYLCYTFTPLLLTNILVTNTSGEDWDQAASHLFFGWSTAVFGAIVGPAVGHAYVGGFNVGAGVPAGTTVNMADAAQLASIGSTSSALKPTLIPADHYVLVGFNNQEGASVGIFTLWEGASTSERVTISPDIPAVPSTEKLNTVLI